MKKELFIIVLLIACAFSLGVSPSKKIIGPIIRGDTYLHKILISYGAEEGTINVIANFDETKLDWINLIGPEKIEVTKGSSKYLEFEVAPPRNINASTYSMQVLIRSVPKTDGDEGSKLVGGVYATITVIVAEEVKPMGDVWLQLLFRFIPIIILGILYLLSKKLKLKKRDDRKRGERPRVERTRITRETKKVKELLKKTMEENTLTETIPVKEEPKMGVEEKIKKTLGKTGIAEIAEEVSIEDEMEKELIGHEEPQIAEEIVKKKKQIKKPVAKKAIKKKKAPIKKKVKETDDLLELEKKLEEQLKLIEQTKKELEKKLKK